jgi:hypothetical protein
MAGEKSAVTAFDQHSISTTDRKAIKEWVEARGGQPVVINDNGSYSDILRIEFPAHGNSEKKRNIKWDEFFQRLEEANLEFFGEENVQGGKKEINCKFVPRIS